MKKIIIIAICLVVQFIIGVAYTINTMKVDITAETSESAIVTVTVCGQCFDHYVEK